jgi:membrane-associated protease RseP (regulator of RpoE activity)
MILRRINMLLQVPVPKWPRCTRRRLLTTAGELLILVVFVAVVGLAAPASAQKEETKQTEQKKDKTSKEQPKKEQADKDQTKKTDADKEIDELVKEMTRNMPNADPAMLKRMREQVRSMPAQQRKNMLSMMKNRPQLGFPGQQPGGAVMPASFAFPGQNTRLGVFVEPPSTTLAEQLDLPKGQGLVIRQVLPDSAAAKAGLKPHDLLLELDGKAIPNRVEELTRLMAAHKADAMVEVLVLRKGKKESIKDVKLPEAKALSPGFPQAGFPGAGQPPAGFPQAPAGFPQPPAGFSAPGIGAAASVVTTLVRTRDNFTLRHQEGNVHLTLTGQMADGKPKIKQIQVQEGLRMDQYESVDKVPEKYRDKVKNLIELSEKSSVKIENKTAP